MPATTKMVCILGSGPSMNRLTDKQLDLLQTHQNTFALNRFYMFHEVIGIVPRTNFLLDTGWPAAYVALKTLERAEREGHAFTYYLHRWYKPLLENRSLAWNVIAEQAKGSGWTPPGHVSCPENVQIRYFDNITESRLPFYWATSPGESLYFYRGSLTTALNLVSVLYPDHHICLLGVDLNTPDRFFSSQENRDRILSGKMSPTYEDRRQRAKKVGLHGTSIRYNGTQGVQSVIPRIRDRLADDGVRLFLGTEGSLLQDEGILPYLPIDEALAGAPIAEPRPPRRSPPTKFDPVDAIPDSPRLAPGSAGSELRVVVVTRELGDANGASRSGRDVCHAIAQMPDVVESVVNVGRSGDSVWQATKKRARRPKPWKTPFFAVKQVIAALPRTAHRLASKLRQRNELIDCCLYNSFNTAEFVDGLDLRSKRSVLIVRESPRHFDDKNKISRADAIAHMQTMDWLIFCSDQIRKEWIRIADMPPSLYIPNASPDREVANILEMDREQLRADWGMSDGEFAVSCVASWQPRKGIDILLDQFETVLASVPSAHCHFVGTSKSPYGRLLLKWLESSSIKDRVTVHGVSHNALEFIRASDVLIIPSRAEAFPRVCLESMSLGTPVVASDVDGIPEMIEHGRTGILFDLDHPELLSEAIVELSRDQELRTRLADEAAGIVRRRFSLDQLYARYAGAVRHIIAS